MTHLGFVQNELGLSVGMDTDPRVKRVLGSLGRGMMKTAVKGEAYDRVPPAAAEVARKLRREMAALFLTGAGLGLVLMMRLSCSAVDDVAYEEVSGATAEIAGHGFVDIGVGGVSFLSKQRGCGHDLSGLAIAALRNLFSDPGILDRMWTVCCKTFDGENSLACRGCDGGLAGAGCNAVDLNGAGSAQTDTAAVFCACHVKQVAEHPEQRHLRIGIYGLLAAVNLKCEPGHCRLPV